MIKFVKKEKFPTTKHPADKTSNRTKTFYGQNILGQNAIFNNKRVKVTSFTKVLFSSTFLYIQIPSPIKFCRIIIIKYDYTYVQ